MLRPAPAPGSRTSPISTSSPRRSRPRRRPATRRTGSPRSPGSACCGRTPTATPTGASDALGGGTYDAATDTYGQGAFNADDISRAAVVYLRDWQQTRSTSSRDRARELLRGLTYLQTASGPNAGNVVLWMQPDGTLNPSADPVEQPDPSDSDASFWLARTLWALGEGYASFRGSDPAFARFLQDRLQLAARAVDRESLDAYGRHHQVDGRSTPAWLIADGADASAEAVLGLAAYAHAGGDPASRRTLVRLSEGISELAGGDARHWPFGAVLPTPTSLSNWHAWASQMPGALSATADVTRQRSLRRTALRDAFTFMPWLLTSGGPDNGRAPSRTDGTQIAYGVDSRVQNLIALAGRSDDGSDNGAGQLAGMTAAWFFGANAARQPAYDPATGVTIDGIAEDGTVNRNSGAESTIHGLLTMLALDAHPSVRRIATQSSEVQGVVGTQYVQAEDGTLGAGATAVVPKDFWTGEAQYDGSGLRRAGGPGQRDARPRRPPALPGDPGLRSPARQLGTHRVQRRGPLARRDPVGLDRPPGRLPRAGCSPAADAGHGPARLGGHPHGAHDGRRRRRRPAGRGPGRSHSSPGSCSAARDTAPLSCGARHGR